MKHELSVTYLGHSCFLLDFDGYRIVLDPYADGSVPGLGPVRETADAVYCSHGHSDHSAAENVTLTGRGAPADFSVEELETDHDDAGGALRGKNTVRRFRFGPISAVHLGDLGRALTEAEAARLERPDLLLIPVGGFFTINAAQAKQIVDALGPRVTVLMHYRTPKSGYPVIASLKKVEAVFGAVRHVGSMLDVEGAAPGVYAMEQANWK